MTWRRAVTVVGLAVVLAGACSVAGWWQWTRHEDRSAQVALVTDHYDAPPVPAADLLADGLDDPEVWRPVTVTGRYVGTAALRNRPVEGTPAAHVLGVLEVSGGPLDGALLVLDRGWVPAADAGPAAVRPAPAGTIRVVARLRHAEPADARTAPPAQVHRLAPRDVLRAAGVAGEPVDAYAVVATEDGGPPADVRPLPRPSGDLGPHLSYAFQWWVFAVGALVGAAVLLRRDAREARAPAASPGPVAARPRRRPTAEDEEDALLDAAERRAAAASAASAAPGPTAAGGSAQSTGRPPGI